MMRRWLGLQETWKLGADDVARLAKLAPLPHDRGAIIAWAHTHRVEHLLGHPITQAAPEARAEARQMSLLDAAVRGTRRYPAHCDHYLSERARSYIRLQAALANALLARNELWKRGTALSNKALAQRLRDRVAAFDLAAISALRFFSDQPVELEADSGICVAVLSVIEVIEVKLQLDDFESSPIRGECESCGTAECIHQAALAARLLDACFDTNDRLHAAVAHFASVPTWQRLLKKLSPAPDTSSNSLHHYAITWRDGQIYAGVHERGRESESWQLMAARKLLRRKTTGTYERAVLNALARCSKTLGPEHIPLDLAALRLLQGQPCSDAAHRTLQLHEQRIEVTFEPCAASGVTVRLSLAGKPLGQLSQHDYIHDYDSKAHTLYFAAIVPELRSAIAALQGIRGPLPAESYGAIAKWSKTMNGVVNVTMPDAMRSHERPTPRKLLLRIEPRPAGGITTWLGVQAFPLTPYWPPGGGDELVYAVEEGTLVHTRRDLEAERALAGRVIEALDLEQRSASEPVNILDEAQSVELALWFAVTSDAQALQVLSAAARMTDELEIEWADHRRNIRPPSVVRASDLTITIQKEGDWLTLRGYASAAGTHVGLDQLLQAARIGMRFIRVEGPSYIEIEAGLLERLEQAQWTAHLTRGEIRIILAAANHWLEDFGTQVAPSDSATASWLADARNRSTQALHSDLELDARLRSYQKAGARWLLRSSDWAPGACLADEMGLGKTIQAIEVLAQRKALGPALIVAPTSLITNWLRELQRFAPSIKAQVYHGKKREHCELGAATATITSYDTLLRDSHLAVTHFSTLVLDEAQLIRNPRTRRARAVKDLDADFRIALTGTPVENSVGDLWSIFHVIAPGLLGTRNNYRSLISAPVDRYKNTGRVQQLRTIVEPLLLRRTKRDVAPELPERIHIVQQVDLSKPERALYTAARDAAWRAFRGKPEEREAERAKRIVHGLADLTKLRQLACHPGLVVPDTRIESSKLQALLTLLEDILPRGHRALVFSQFTAHLRLIEIALHQRKISTLYLDGSTPAMHRHLVVDRFQRGEAEVFLVSLKAGGTGLNLTQADYVIHMDPWWNPAAEDQASDRAHRIGQTRPVSIVRLVAKDTVEEHVLGLHEHKRWVATSVLAGRAPEIIDVSALEALLRE